MTTTTSKMTTSKMTTSKMSTSETSRASPTSVLPEEKWRGLWRERRDVRAMRDAWASLQRRARRRRQSAGKEKDQGRSSKRARGTFEEGVANRNHGERVDARDLSEYGLRGLDDTDEYYAEYGHDTIWGDTVVATRREPCASPPVQKLNFEAIAKRLPATPPLEPSKPAPASVNKAASSNKLNRNALPFVRLEAAAPLDKSVGQLVVDKTILCRSIVNDEPLVGGNCTSVALVTGPMAPCLGGSLSVIHGAPEALYYEVWDHFEEYPDKVIDVRVFDLTGDGRRVHHLSSLRELLSCGPPFELGGNPVDLQTMLAKRREPLGYSTDRRLLPAQDLIFIVSAAVFIQSDVVLLDAATAMPRYAIVRRQSPNARRQPTRAPIPLWGVSRHPTQPARAASL